MAYRRFVRLLALVLVLASGLVPLRPVKATSEPIGWAIPSRDGYFYRSATDADGLGFIVSNEQGIPFWDTFRKYGPVGLGYPISHRFSWNGRVTQVFQRGALQWNPIVESVEVVALAERLHEAGFDDWLEANHGIPRRAPEDALPNGETLAETASLRGQELEQAPRLAAFYRTLPDPLGLLGMPTSPVQQIGDALAVRTQLGALQVWRRDVPWAKAGEVAIAPMGSLAAELGLFPSGEHWLPMPAPEPPPAEPFFDDTVPLDPSAVEIPPGRRWIDVDMARQRIYAMVDETPVYWAPAAFGRPGWETPTGRFRILRRVLDETMNSATVGIPPSSPEYYFFRHVYYTQYFNTVGDALHTNYWQPVSVLGSTPTTHGCVGLFYKDAEFFWHFAQIGTEVVIHP